MVKKPEKKTDNRRIRSRKQSEQSLKIDLKEEDNTRNKNKINVQVNSNEEDHYEIVTGIMSRIGMVG